MKKINKIFIGSGVVATTGVAVIAGVVISHNLNKKTKSFKHISKDHYYTHALLSENSNHLTLADSTTIFINNIIPKLLEKKGITLKNTPIAFTWDQDNLFKQDNWIKMNFKNANRSINAELILDFSPILTATGREEFVNSIKSIKLTSPTKLFNYVSLESELNERDGSYIYSIDNKSLHTDGQSTTNQAILNLLEKQRNTIKTFNIPREINELKLIYGIDQKAIEEAIFGNKDKSNTSPSSLQNQTYLAFNGYKIIEMKVMNKVVDWLHSSVEFDYEMILTHAKYPNLKRVGHTKIDGMASSANLPIDQIKTYIENQITSDQHTISNNSFVTFGDVAAVATPKPMTPTIYNKFMANIKSKTQTIFGGVTTPPGWTLKYKIDSDIAEPTTLAPDVSGTFTLLLTNDATGKTSEITKPLKVYNQTKTNDEIDRLAAIQARKDAIVAYIKSTKLDIRGMDIAGDSLETFVNLLNEAKAYADTKNVTLDSQISGPFTNGIGEDLYLINGVDLAQTKVDQITQDGKWENGWDIYNGTSGDWWNGLDLSNAISDNSAGKGSLVFMVEPRKKEIEYAYIANIQGHWKASQDNERVVLHAN